MGKKYLTVRKRRKNKRNVLASKKYSITIVLALKKYSIKIKSALHGEQILFSVNMVTAVISRAMRPCHLAYCIVVVGKTTATITNVMLLNTHFSRL